MNEISRPRIFIGSSVKSLPIAKGIAENFIHEDIEVRIWNDTGLFQTNTFTLDELVRFTAEFDFAIFVWEGEDTIIDSKDKTEKLITRDNVILETGMFYGALGRQRVFIFLPKDKTQKTPTDLLGLQNLIYYSKPSDGIYAAEVRNGTNEIIKKIKQLGKISVKDNVNKYVTMYPNLEAAKKVICEDCLKSREIKILSNKGGEFFGNDGSIISNSNSKKYTNLEQLKIILLSPQSKWLNRGLIALRNGYDTIEDFKKELRDGHTSLENRMKRFLKNTGVSKSGIKYHKGEPLFRFIMTETSVFVSSYAENHEIKVKDLPVFEYKNEMGSMYGALKRHFDDLWKNNSEFGETLKEYMDIEVSAGGIVFCKHENEILIVLVQRYDGSWVLPKGHKMKDDGNAEDTAIREIYEETGIQISQLKCNRHLDSFNFEDTNGTPKINHFYLVECKIENNLPELKTDIEHRSVRWWNIKDELPFLYYEYQKQFLSTLIKREFDITIKVNPR